MMTKLGFAAVLAVPAVMAACARAPEPEPVAAPVLSGPEQACAAQAAQTAGVDPSLVSVTPVTATKTGATVYNVIAGEVAYTCVVEADMTISEFAPQ